MDSLNDHAEVTHNALRWEAQGCGTKNLGDSSQPKFRQVDCAFDKCFRPRNDSIDGISESSIFGHVQQLAEHREGDFRQSD